MKEGARCIVAAPSERGPVEATEAFLLCTIHIIREWIAGVLNSLKEGLKEGVVAGGSRELERSLFSAVGVSADESILQSLEVGKDVSMVLMKVKEIESIMPKLQNKHTTISRKCWEQMA